MTAPDGSTLTPEETRMLEGLLERLSGPGAELPWPLFRFVTEVSATVNVDLLVRDDAGSVLLAWRDDPFGQGWHVPGSIIRHREEIAHRIAACAEEEYGCKVDVADRPVAVVQIFDDRGHSISLCFPARLREVPGRLVPDGSPQAGDLRWFRTSPAGMYPSHLVYRDVIAASDRGELATGARIFTQHVGRRDAAQMSSDGSIGPGSLA